MAEAATTSTAVVSAARRNSAYLPTPLERLAIGLLPLILVFGTLFSVLSPEMRAAPYDDASQSHAQGSASLPSYFARKSNMFNLVFVKRGWGWTTFAFVLFLVSHPSGGVAAFDLTPRRLRAGLRWLLITTWWFFVTQWFFGPPVIDRGFRWTGGQCETAERGLGLGASTVRDKVTAAACKAAGGRWRGGHDISGHVFLLVLGSAFLMQEFGWTVLRWTGALDEERSIVMPDGALKGAGLEAETRFASGQSRRAEALGASGKVVLAVMGLELWMLLMTAIYFHTWFEKFTGLMMALLGIYAVYLVPRFLPALRAVIGLPGI